MKILAKRFVTLIEMMIVMFLIAMIIGVVAYNYQGSLQEGKAFKTKAGIEKLNTILLLKVAEDPGSFSNMDTQWQDYVRSSPLVQNPQSLFKDGWGEDYRVSAIAENDGEYRLLITSPKYEAYKRKHATMFGDEKSSD